MIIGGGMTGELSDCVSLISPHLHGQKPLGTAQDHPVSHSAQRDYTCSSPVYLVDLRVLIGDGRGGRNQ